MAGSIQNRESFLESITKQLNRPRKITVERPVWKFQPQKHVLADLTKDELVAVLEEQCQYIHTQFVHSSTANLQQDLRTVMTQYGDESIITAKDVRFEQFGLQQFLNNLPNENIHYYEWDYQAGEKNIEEANKANIGISISEMTLAESGTPIIFSDKDHGRSIQFLPQKSIYLIPKSTLVPRMTQGAQYLREKVAQGQHIPSCVNYITGPSNSADIEMIPVIGCHGPIKATYILIDDK